MCLCSAYVPMYLCAYVPMCLCYVCQGGYLAKVAPQRIGTKLDGFIHICDYYTTFAAIAGVDPTDTRAALAKLPPVDGLNLWPCESTCDSREAC
jgi:hypothetical protein